MYDDQLIRTANRRLSLAAGLLSMTVLALGVTVAELATRPPPPPYVIAIDHGETVGYAQAFTADSTLAPQVIQQQLELFIREARSITTDTKYDQDNIHRSYAMVRGQALQALNASYKPSTPDDPIHLGYSGLWREVQLTRFLTDPAPDTYRVEWTETEHPKFGGADTTRHEAVMQIVLNGPTSALNPIGLYLVALNWSKQ